MSIDTSVFAQYLTKYNSIDGLTTGDTVIYTVPTGKTLYPICFVITLESGTNIVTGPTLDITVNGGPLTVSGGTANNMINVGDSIILFPDSSVTAAVFQTMTAGTQINLSVNGAATADLYTLSVIIIGIAY